MSPPTIVAPRPLTATPPRPVTRARTGGALILTAILLVAVNLRAAITSLGSLLDEVRTGLDLSATVAGMITTLPALSFAAFGALTPWLARRIAPARLLLLAMGLLAGGQLVRVLTGSAAVFLTTSAAALAGIAIANVLLPVLVKEYFPGRTGLVTGVYTMALIAGSSTAAAVSVPVAHAFGSWRAGLGVWVLLAAAGLVPLLLVRPRPAAPDAPDAERLAVRPGRTGLGWAMALYFGLQSLSGYATMGWLPQIFRDAGYHPATAGLLMAGVPAVGVPLAFLMPALAARGVNLRALVLALSAAMGASYVGLAFAPHTMPMLWVSLLAIGQSAFPLSLAMIGMRSRTPGGTVALSAFTQSAGYLVAALGPLLVGVFYEMTGGWRLPLTFLFAAAVLQAFAGLAAARPRYIEDARPAA